MDEDKVSENMSPELPPTSRQPQELIPTVYAVIGVVVLLILGIGIIVGVIYLAQNYAAELEALRDVFIIALALESCVFGIVLMLMLLMLIRLVNTLEFEIKPILEQTNETVSTVRGTSTFVSTKVITPVIRVTSVFSGIRKGAQALFGDPTRNIPD
jgi:tellurite resistance protein TehA-like permease